MKYKDYWEKMKHKVITLEPLCEKKSIKIKLDSRLNIISPVVLEKDIVKFEEIHSVKLPEVYRDYLLYFGSSGVGPKGGPYDFYEDLLIKSKRPYIHLDSQLVKIEGPDGRCEFEIKDSHPIHQAYGLMGILAPYNPVTHYLVVTGNESGRVFAWDNFDTLCDLGYFDEWYDRWINRVIERLNETKI